MEIGFSGENTSGGGESQGAGSGPGSLFEKEAKREPLGGKAVKQEFR